MTPREHGCHAARLAIDDDGFWYRNVVEPQRPPHRAGGSDLDKPGTAASWRSTGSPTTCSCGRMRDGNAPTMARWLRGGSHRPDPLGDRLVLADGRLPGRAAARRQRATCRPSAGGRRTAAAAIVTNHPRDAAELERRHSDGRGLLFSDGASRANIVSGDAPHSLLTMSTVLQPGPSRPHRPGLLRLLRQSLQHHPHVPARRSGEMFSERWQRLPPAAPGRAARGSPRSRTYALVRAWATVIQRDLQVDLDDRRHVRGAAGRSTRPSSPTTRSPTTPGSSGPRRSRRSRHVDRQIGRHRARPPSSRPAATSWWCSPTTASRRGRRSSTAMGSPWRSSCEQVDRMARPPAVDGNPSEALGLSRAGLSEARGREQRRWPGSPPATRAPRERPTARSAARRGAATSAGRAPRERRRDRRLPEVVVMASGCLGLI